MNINKIAILPGLVAGAAVAMSVAPAHAASLSFVGGGSDLAACNGQTQCNVNGFTLSAEPAPDATLAAKTVNGVSGLGVEFSAGNGGPGSEKELDFFEMLNISVNTPNVIKSLDLVFLYDLGEFGDWVQESALVEVTSSLGNVFQGILTVTGEETADWIFDGGSAIEVTASSSATNSGGGWFGITNPFGDIEVASVSLKAPLDSGAEGTQTFRYSDYSLGAIETVPEPGTLLGLGALLVGAATSLKGSKQTEA